MARKNKAKAQIVDEIKMKQKVEHMKDIVRNTFPVLAPVEHIYDGQTVVNALAGYIGYELEKKTQTIKLSELTIDLTEEKEGPIKTAMVTLLDILKDEPADELSQTLERLGRALSDVGAEKFLKNPMSEVKLEDILAE